MEEMFALLDHANTDLGRPRQYGGRGERNRAGRGEDPGRASGQFLMEGS